MAAQSADVDPNAPAPVRLVQRFMAMEASGGIVLVLAAALAIILANSALADWYTTLFGTKMILTYGGFGIEKPLLLWINDGLMAVFFFLIGLEIKREFLQGELSSRDRALLPAIGALGGMALPAAIFVAINWDQPQNLDGWAIPAATDIAFALGVLALVGSRAPLALKVLLTAIAVIDDLGAILIIALFYTENLSINALIVAAVGLSICAFMNMRGVTRISLYIMVGLVVWFAVLKSGVHATLAGVALAMFIPISPEDADGHSPLEHLEHTLHPWVAFFVLPVFAFANAGVSFAGMSLASLFEPLPLGISAGLFIGKQVGIFGLVFLTVKLGISPMPKNTNWLQIYAVSLLCGIGFTMSLFIGGLAYDSQDAAAGVRLGVLSGSILAAIIGYSILRFGPTKAGKPGVKTQEDAAAHG